MLNIYSRHFWHRWHPSLFQVWTTTFFVSCVNSFNYEIEFSASSVIRWINKKKNSFRFWWNFGFLFSFFFIRCWLLRKNRQIYQRKIKKGNKRNETLSETLQTKQKTKHFQRIQKFSSITHIKISFFLVWNA